MNIRYINFDYKVNNIKYKFNKLRKKKFFYSFFNNKKVIKEINWYPRKNLYYKIVSRINWSSVQ